MIILIAMSASSLVVSEHLLEGTRSSCPVRYQRDALLVGVHQGTGRDVVIALLAPWGVADLPFGLVAEDAGTVEVSDRTPLALLLLEG
jgi:hypothetical protein